ncbi:MAG: DsbE family thiol:disulfide interchange protein [Minwuia sp.]|uniref:DsbE family thiol:disulfide interchange protein n=1 Tax=Minwuia sp. TaxID=2493630 RepID=UPI003A842E4A
MTDATEEQPQRGGSALRWLWAIVPVGVFAVIGFFLYQGLSLNPQSIPSVLIDKPAPEFELPPLPGKGSEGFARSDLTGEPKLVNVFASWCVACRVEHPLLMEMQKQGVVPIYGLNYKDAPAEAVGWLNRFGDPYDRIGMDRNGRVGIDFGVYGVPETFVIDGNGTIVHKVIGPITPQILKDELMPLLAELRK